MHVLTMCILFLLVQQYETQFSEEYSKARNNVLYEEQTLSLGGNLSLTQEEKEANKLIMHWKHKAIKECFNYTDKLDIWESYFTYGQVMKTSMMFQIIKKMPKGAAIHLHSSFMLDADSLLKLTHEEEDHLYACLKNEYLEFQFSYTEPILPCPVQWKLLSKLREISDNVKQFDDSIWKHFNIMFQGDSDDNINVAWDKFENVHTVINSLISYRPMLEKYFYQILKKFYDDNVIYLEFRTELDSVYELNGLEYERLYTATVLQRITNKFIKENPDFIGIKLILTCYRASSEEKVREALDLAKALKEEMPEIFAGFDLVGQEDLGKPLSEFVPLLRQYKDLNFFFHAGETLWFGSSSDENLVDAILLGAKRIGHGYSLIKHPILLEVVREKNIGLEVNVVSNAILSLVKDVRNHPLATYLALGIPVILASDGTSAWSNPLTHDFYVAFIHVASNDYDIRMLKQLALNSIKYSALDAKAKEKCFHVFSERWNKFIKDLVKMRVEMSKRKFL